MWPWVALAAAIVAVVVLWAVAVWVGRPAGSVTVCLVVRDQEATVEGQVAEALAWCAALRRRATELLVVDAGSVDATADVLARLAARHPALKIVPCADDTREGAGPLTTALAASNGDWLLVRHPGRWVHGPAGQGAGGD